MLVFYQELKYIFSYYQYAGYKGVKVAIFCFKKLHLKDQHKFEYLFQGTDGERLFSAVIGVACFVVKKPLDFQL